MSVATAVKERPILFSGPMVQAILAGRKTMTRRIVKPQPPSREWFMKRAGQDCGFYMPAHNDYRMCGAVGIARDFMGAEWPRDDYWHCPYGQTGSRLWVREAFLPCLSSDPVSPRIASYVCFRDGSQMFRNGPTYCPWTGEPPKWDDPRHRFRPPIHMPRWASRITLEVTGVRVERLQEITLSDIAAEGIPPNNEQGWDSKDEFSRLWDKINGAGSWAANPWVWVVSFKRLEAQA